MLQKLKNNIVSNIERNEFWFYDHNWFIIVVILYLIASTVGAIFSSPKLLLSGTCTTNPFAMRSSPNRMTGSEASSGDNSSAPSIIAPSKFGALPSPIGSTFSANPQLHESSGNSLIKLINNNK